MTLGMLETKNLAIGYRRPRQGTAIVAADIKVALRGGELVCLLGPNGAGKSTLIRTLAGLQAPLAGTVCLDGTTVHDLPSRELAKRMSLVLTQRVAVGMMPVSSFVALGRHPYTDWTGKLRRRDEEVVRRVIAEVGIESLAHRPLCELSDGERQKVKIARALAQEPRIMILDEATAFLDLPRRVELMLLLKRLAHEGGLAILLSTHDLDLALRAADRLWLLSPGGSLRVGCPEDLVLNDAFAATFAAGGIAFDKSAGSFLVSVCKRGTVALRGDGIPGIWTYRALERVGYRVLPDGPAPVAVRVLREDEGLSWYLGDVRCRSVDGLLRLLDERYPRKSMDVSHG